MACYVVTYESLVSDDWGKELVETKGGAQRAVDIMREDLGADWKITEVSRLCENWK